MKNLNASWGADICNPDRGPLSVWLGLFSHQTRCNIFQLPMACRGLLDRGVVLRRKSSYHPMNISILRSLDAPKTDCVDLFEKS